ncbi:hypothetical protein [Tabrizicola sp.]|uniref:hypothetical protein n=1 Tax=Tabrizicola sp. TaxID=2005166 RepID=UPI003F3F4CED
MRSTVLPLFLLALQACPALAETPMTAEEFDAFVTGKTMDFADNGVVFGTEEYLPGRRVRWAFTGDLCEFGSWYEDNGYICFVYDSYPGQHCWTVWRDGDQLATLPAGDSPDATPMSITEATVPLQCQGPDVGV